MEDIVSRIERYQKRHRIACYTFIGAITLLYMANFVIQTFVYQESVWKLLKDFLLPLVVTATVYVIDWNYNYSTSLIFTHIPKVKMIALCAPVVAIFLSILSYEPHRDEIDFNITILAMTSMYVAPYALRDVQRSCVAIVFQAVAFVIAAAKLGNNTAAIITIFITACTLICCLPKLSWFNYGEEHVQAKTYVGLVMLYVAMMVVFLAEETEVMEAFYISSLERPGVGSSSFVNQQCAEVFREAKLLGSVSREYYLDAVFSHRVLTYVLAKAGWLAVVPLILSLTMIIISGIYLCRKNIAIQYYISVSFFAVIVVQTVGYCLTCIGFDEFLFPEVCPFLDGSFMENTLFLLMGICILPPKQRKLPDMHVQDTDEDDLEEWLSSCFDINAE